MKTFTVEGQDYLEKTVSKQSDTTGKIYLPGAWIGCRVAVILISSDRNEKYSIPCPNCWTPQEGNMATLENLDWKCTHCDGVGTLKDKKYRQK